MMTESTEHHHKNDEEEHHHHVSPRRIHEPLQPWLLLLLLQKPTHGYELMERLSQSENISVTDPGLLYRTLRQLEEEGMLQSSWDTEGQGPARRLYQVTPEGTEYLHAWAANIRQTQTRLTSFLAEYKKHFGNEKNR
jgi:poly-beta-hydroxybutyrate-responsive repressor